MVPVITGPYFGGLAGYRVEATHNATTGDTYAISVYTSAGVLWHQAGTTTKQLLLGGGNIVVHHNVATELARLPPMSHGRGPAAIAPPDPAMAL